MQLRIHKDIPEGVSLATIRLKPGSTVEVPDESWDRYKVTGAVDLYIRSGHIVPLEGGSVPVVQEAGPPEEARPVSGDAGSSPAGDAIVRTVAEMSMAELKKAAAEIDVKIPKGILLSGIDNVREFMIPKIKEHLEK